MKARMRTMVLLLFLMIGQISFGQHAAYDSIQVQRLLSRISYLQQYHEADFPAGLIPSYREYHYNKGVLKNDDNIFFTGLVVFTLRSLQPFLDKRSQMICDSIIGHAAPLYATYRNQKGRPTYNFWRTDDPQIFPHSGWLNLFNKSQALPDDLDDTAILLLANNSADSTAIEVHRLMQEFVNSDVKRVRSTLQGYKNLHAYSTWFGKKMPVDFDFCVLTNILLMVHKYRLPYTAADSASLQLLCRVVEQRHYMKKASRVSPHYSRTPILLYHLSRLMAETKIAALERWKPQLIRDAKSSYKKAGNFLDKILLSTALMRWGVSLPDETVNIDTDLEAFIESNDFVFFIANITSILPRPLNVWLGRTGIGKFSYYSPAWNYALVLENLVWRRRE